MYHVCGNRSSFPDGTLWYGVLHAEYWLLALLILDLASSGVGFFVVHSLGRTGLTSSYDIAEAEAVDAELEMF